VPRTRWILFAVAAAFFAAVVALPAAAVDGDDPATATAPDPGGEPKPQGYRASARLDNAPWGGTDENTLRLSVDDAIAQAIENNLGVQIQRFNPLIAEEDLEIAWGAYDPSFEAEIGYDSMRRPSASALEADLSTSTLVDGAGGFVGLLPFLSTQYSAKIASNRGTTNSPVQTLSPDYKSNTVFSITQPLLKDLIWNQPWTRVKINNINYDSSIEDFRLALMDIVAGTEDAYWELIAAHEDMLVAQKSLETAQALLNQTQTQYEVGVVSKVEVIQSDAGVADREFKLIVAENRYRLAQDRLIDIVLGERLRPDTTLAIEPTDRADEFTRCRRIHPRRVREPAGTRTREPADRPPVDPGEVREEPAAAALRRGRDLHLQGPVRAIEPQLCELRSRPLSRHRPALVQILERLLHNRRRQQLFGARDFLDPDSQHRRPLALLPIEDRAAPGGDSEAPDRAGHHLRNPQGGARSRIGAQWHRSLGARRGRRGRTAARGGDPPRIRRIDPLRRAAA